MLMPLPITDTREAFRPLCREIVDLLHTLVAEDWERPTIAGGWRVRDVVAHMLDTTLRRLSLHRDRSLPPGMRPATTDQELVTFINDLNATWIRAAARLSTRVLTDLYTRASTELADFVETLDLRATAVFPVSWAGETQSVQWLDIGREFTEAWHHGSQIRSAVGAGPFSDPSWLQAVLQIALHALPHAYREMQGPQTLSILIRITGRTSGEWTLHRRNGLWDMDEGSQPGAAAIATMSDEVAWRLFFNALPLAEAQSAVQLEGDTDLARPLLDARSVIV